ncbi:MAG: hypothetical protein JXR86_17540 [Spirochaetales bacterium]|nr:hypothetical protein [Spirochaetales bacterium]
MKKQILMCALCFLVLTLLPGQTEIKGMDLLFLNGTGSALFPELSYGRYPSVLNNLKEKTLLNHLEFSMDYQKNVQERIDDSIGAAGGTGTDLSLHLLPLLSFSLFIPLESGSLFGIDISYQSNHSYENLSYLNYNSVSEDSEMETSMNLYDFGADLYLALPAGEKSLDLGFALGYSLEYKPKVFRWITDRTFNPSLIYADTTGVTNPVDSFRHGINGSASIDLYPGKSTLSFSLLYRGIFEDSSAEYRAVDTDGDGYKDTLYTLKDYYFLLEEDGGPTDNVTSFNHEALAVTTNLDLAVTTRLPISEKTDWIIDGQYKIIGYRFDHYMQHILTDLLISDSSYYDQIYNSGLGSFMVMTGFDLRNREKNRKFRLGFSYSRYGEVYSQNGDSAAGQNLFNSLNPGHYTELSLGTDPANNSIIAYELYPSETVIHSFSLAARSRWTPLKDMAVYFDFSISALYQLLSYRAFNLDTLSVWEETESSTDLDWEINSLVGLAFPVGEKFLMTVDLKNLTTIGETSFTSETHMKDIDLNRYSEDGTGYLLEENAFNFSVNLGFMAQW